MIDSSAWTGRFWWIGDLDDEDDMTFGVPPALYRQLAEDEATEDRRQAWKAIKMLWGPPIRSRARDSRKGWTIYDGYERERGEEWTLWRAFVATVAIITGRRWGQRQADAAERAWARFVWTFRGAWWNGERWVEGKWPSGGDSVDMGHWDACETYGGYEIRRLSLYPWARVDIFSDGECLM